MEKINGKKTVYELVKENNELKKVLVNIGLTPLNNEAMLNTVGRMMSLNEGIKQIGLSKEELKAQLEAAGYELVE